jgi:hypothetical protein
LSSGIGKQQTNLQQKFTKVKSTNLRISETYVPKLWQRIVNDIDFGDSCVLAPVSTRPSFLLSMQLVLCTERKEDYGKRLRLILFDPATIIRSPFPLAIFYN